MTTSGNRLSAVLLLLGFFAHCATVRASYVGCYRDAEDRVLEHWLLQGGATVESCTEGCRDLGYTYAGLQIGKECFCGNTYDTLLEADNCNFRCGIHNLECGGHWANSVYTTVPTVYEGVPTTEGYVGCWTDNEDRVMDFLFERSTSITVAACIEGCKAHGFLYAGLEYQIECFCGNEYTSLGESNNCHMDCLGECGGGWALSVYEAGDGNVRSNHESGSECVATAWGDPHVITYDGLMFDVHALGELTFLKSKNTDFEIQARLEAVQRSGNPAVTTGVVIREADANLPKIQVSLARSSSSPQALNIRDDCYVQLYEDDVLRDITTGTTSDDAHVSVIGRLIKIEYPSTNLRLDMEVVVWSNTCHFSVDYILLDCRPDDDLTGILGSPDGNSDNDWTTRSGSVVPIPEGAENFFFKPAYDYCLNWCIPTEGESLFAYEDGTSFDTFDFCDNPYDDTLEKIIEETNEEVNELCQGDIGCMIDTETLGFEAGNAYLNEPALGANVANNLLPSPVSGSNGDPHFRTWQNEHFEFHGQCDMILVSDPNFADGVGLEVQIRTKLVRFWSYIKNASIRIGTDIFEVEGSADPEGTGAKYWLNFQSGAKLESIGGFPIDFRARSESKGVFVFTIDLSSKFPGEKIVISTYKEFVRVDFVNGSKDSFGRSVGLLGDFQSGATVARDGSTVLDDFIEFGNEWQLLPSDDMLFHSTEEPQFPKRCFLPEDPRGSRRRRLDGSSISEQDAEAACAQLKDPLDRKDCVYDVLATQDLDMVGAF